MNAPTAEALRAQLADLGDGLAAQLAELQARPTPERAERVATNLDGARLLVTRFGASLREEGGDGR